MNELEIIQYQKIDGLRLFFNTVDYRTPHFHPEWELIWVLKNTLSVICNQNHYLIEPGQMILFNPNEPHEFRKTSAGCTFVCLQISRQILPISPHLYADSHFPHEFLSAEEMKTLQFQFRNMLNIYLSQAPQYELYCVGQCCLIFHLLFSHIPNHALTPEQASSIDKRSALLKRLIDFVDKNYMYKIRLSDFAELEGYSMSYLSHFIKKTMNQTFQEYVTSVRVSCARNLIAHGKKQMLEICLESGFSDYRYFVKAFRNLYGMTPEEYRRSRKEELCTAVTSRSLHSEERLYSREESLIIFETLM